MQVTNLGITVKDSPQNTLIFVTRLDDGAPVAGAKVSIRTMDNKVFWSGTTDANGIAIAPNTDLRREKKKSDERTRGGRGRSGGDSSTRSLHRHRGEGRRHRVRRRATGTTASSRGSSTSNFNLDEADPLLRGTIFTDRGVYKLGEEVHAKVRAAHRHAVAASSCCRPERRSTS